MSEWIFPTIDDIELSEDDKELHVYIESDRYGSRYISIEGKALEYLRGILKESGPIE